MKRIYSIEESCIGCGLCEVYCKVRKSKSKDLIKAFKEYPQPQSMIRLEVLRPISFTVQCRHCEDPLCIDACLSGALSIDESTGTVLSDETKCIGCWSCIMVCPIGALIADFNHRKVIAKCDMCISEGEPICVTNCPNEALVFEDRSSTS